MVGTAGPAPSSRSALEPLGLARPACAERVVRTGRSATEHPPAELPGAAVPALRMEERALGKALVMAGQPGLAACEVEGADASSLAAGEGRRCTRRDLRRASSLLRCSCRLVSSLRSCVQRVAVAG